MIDVSPYIQKLDMLRKYMAMRIDSPKIWMNVPGIPTLDPTAILNLFFQTGIMLFNCPDGQPVEELSFNDWYKTQIQ